MRHRCTLRSLAAALLLLLLTLTSCLNDPFSSASSPSSSSSSSSTAEEEEEARVPTEELRPLPQANAVPFSRHSAASGTAAAAEAAAAGELPQGVVVGVGSVVNARWGGQQRYFTGEIMRVHPEDGTVDIQYDDGDFEARVPAALLQPVLVAPPVFFVLDSAGHKVRKGVSVVVHWQGGTKEYPGVVTDVHRTGLLDIQYSDGDTEDSVEPHLVRRVLKPEALAAAQARRDEGLEDPLTSLALRQNADPVLPDRPGRSAATAAQARDRAAFDSGRGENADARNARASQGSPQHQQHQHQHQHQHQQNARPQEMFHNTPPCAPGVAVHALYAGNNQWYSARIERIDVAGGFVLVSWDDGDPRFRRVAARQTHIRGCRLPDIVGSQASTAKSSGQPETTVPDSTGNGPQGDEVPGRRAGRNGDEMESRHASNKFFETAAWRRLLQTVLAKVNTSAVDESNSFFSSTREGRNHLHAQLVQTTAFQRLVDEGWTAPVHTLMLKAVADIGDRAELITRSTVLPGQPSEDVSSHQASLARSLQREAAFETAELLRLLGTREGMAAAVSHYNHAATLGHAGAQRQLALLPGTPQSEAVVLLFASSLGGDVPAMLALAHRHQQGGMGVPRSCQAALSYYEAAAAKVAEEYELRQLDQSTYLAGLHSYLADKDKYDAASSGYRQSRASTDEFFEMYEYLAADGNQEAQVTFGTLLLEQLSENTFHGAADSRSLASLLSSPRSSHDESLLKPNVAMNKVAAEGPAAEGDNEFASTSHTTNSRDGSTTLPAAVSRIARAFLNIAGLVGRTLLAVLGLDDLPLALGGTAGLGSANRLSEAAGLASVKNWLLEVVNDNEMAVGAIDDNVDSDSFSDADRESVSSAEAQTARQSSGAAMFILGKIALAVDKPGEALRWFKRGARHEDPSCIRELGARLLYSNDGGRRGWPASTQPQDFDEAALLLQQAVNLGSSWAAYDLALMHIAGLGPFTTDLTYAQRLLAKAAKKHIVPAMYLLYQLQHLDRLRSGDGAQSQSGLSALLRGFGFGNDDDAVCERTVTKLKVVAEQAHAVVWKYREAERFLEHGHDSAALLSYLEMAGMGQTNANANAGWLLSLRLNAMQVHDTGSSNAPKGSQPAGDDAVARDGGVGSRQDWWQWEAASSAVARFVNAIERALDSAEAWLDSGVAHAARIARSVLPASSAAGTPEISDDDDGATTSPTYRAIVQQLHGAHLPSEKSMTAESLVWELRLGSNNEPAVEEDPSDPPGSSAADSSKPIRPFSERLRRSAHDADAKQLLMQHALALLETSVAQGWSNGNTYLGDLYYAYAGAQAQELAQRTALERLGAVNSSTIGKSVTPPPEKLYAKAVESYREAIRGRHARGAFNLGMMYTLGLGVKDGRPDLHKAAGLFNRAFQYARMRGVNGAQIPVQIALYGLRAMDAFLQLGDWIMEWPVEATAETAAGFLFDVGLLGSGEAAEVFADSIVGFSLSVQENLACVFYAASLQGRFRTVYNRRWGSDGTVSTSSGGSTPGKPSGFTGTMNEVGVRRPAVWPAAPDASSARAQMSDSGGASSEAAEPDSADAKFFVGQRVRARWMGGRSYYHGYVQRINRPSPHEQASDAARPRRVTYDIQYDDGDFESGQREELMEPLAEEAVAVVDWSYWDAWIVLGVVIGLAVLSLSLVTIVIVAAVKAVRDCLGM